MTFSTKGTKGGKRTSALAFLYSLSLKFELESRRSCVRGKSFPAEVRKGFGPKFGKDSGLGATTSSDSNHGQLHAITQELLRPHGSRLNELE